MRTYPIISVTCLIFGSFVFWAQSSAFEVPDSTRPEIRAAKIEGKLDDMVKKSFGKYPPKAK